MLTGAVLAVCSVGALAAPDAPPAAEPTKIVLIAGANIAKPGEHEYAAGSAVLRDLLKQTPGVQPVLAVDWPAKADTFAGARAVGFFFDGGDKHALLKDGRLAQVQKLAEAGVGLVHLHQTIDYPKDLGDRVRHWCGAAWEKGHSQRAHWVAEFTTFPEHPVCRGVKAFKIDDGWLSKVRFGADMKGVTPLLHTADPKVPAGKQAGAETVVCWAYERPGGGRAFTFTGGHLHSSFAEEGYRRLLVNGILWAAGAAIPPGGAPVVLETDGWKKYLENRPKADGK